MQNKPKDWAFALHGGAGAVAGRDYTETEQHMRNLAQTCREKLAHGIRALDVVEHAVTELEALPFFVQYRLIKQRVSRPDGFTPQRHTARFVFYITVRICTVLR